MSTPTRTPTPATDKQLAWLDKLTQDRVFSFDNRDTLTAKQASALIDAAKAAPFRDRLPVGLYLSKAGDVVKVQARQDGNGVYAKRLVLEGQAVRTGTWKYEPGLIGDLKGAVPVDRAIAAELGQMSGVCVVCAKTLSDADRVVGIGAACAAQF